MRTNVWAPKAGNPGTFPVLTEYPDCAAAVRDDGGLSVFEWPSRVVRTNLANGTWTYVEVRAS